ncbi:MAG: hypothetical protein HQM06_07535 [Magnetococcales bacterium]|nr:hypothetical protein [Magnetococcales bacterium]
MATRLRILFFWGCCALLLAIPQQAVAFALGELQIQSRLGQPLQAVAPIALDPGEEIVAVNMGGNSDYLTLNLPRKAVVNQISAELSEQGGRLLVSLRSSAPIREADFYLVLRLSSNHHTYFPFLRVRPGAAENQAAVTPAKGAQVPPPKQNERSEESSKAASKEGQEKTYGPVRAKEGLRDVARRFAKGTPFTVQQVEVAIWRRNGQHFTRNNMNGLKAGVKLLIPSHEEIARISKKEAKEIRISQAAEWKKTAKERAASSASPPVAVAPQQPSSPEKVNLPVVQAETADKPAAPRPAAKEPVASKETAKPTVASAEPKTEPGKESGSEQIKVESGTLKAILVQLQTITRVLENHHERQEQLEKRVTVLEKNQEHREQLEKRVTALERAVKEWNYITKEHRAAGEK